jgi:REP element-mobilizing transposase RayT
MMRDFCFIIAQGRHRGLPVQDEINIGNGNNKMIYNPTIHHRRSIRLKGYDYSQAGLYYITICTQNRQNLFGEINVGQMKLNDAGLMVATIWNEIPEHYSGFGVHEFIVMPNHIHGIIEIVARMIPTVAISTKRARTGACPYRREKINY